MATNNNMTGSYYLSK